MLAMRCNSAIEGGVQRALQPALLALLADGIHHVVPFAPFGDELRQHLRRILQVGIHDDHAVAPGMVQPGADGDLMPEVARELHHRHVRIVRGEIVHDRQAPIAAAVIHEDDLVIGLGITQHLGHPLIQHRQVLLFFIDRNDNRQRGARAL